MHSKFSVRTLWGFPNAPAFVFAIVSGLFAVAASAADVTSTWSAATSGNWNDNTRWTNAPVTGGFPNNGNGGVATYDAVINPVGAPYTVTLNTDVTVEDLSLSSANATLSQTAGTLTASGAINLTAGTYSLAGGTIAGSTVNATVPISLTANSTNTLSGVTVNGDLSFPVNFARVVIAGGTTFSTAHLSGLVSEISFAPAQTLSGTIQFEGAGGNIRYVSMSTPGSLTIGATGVIKTLSGLTGDAVVGVGSNFTAAMALTNNGLISSEISGRTITVNPATSFANGATGTLQATGGGILTIAPSGAWTNAGMINVNAATVNLGGTLNTTGGIGTWSNTGGTVNVTGTISNTASTLTLNNATGSWTLNGGTVSGGTLALTDGKTLLIGANSANTLSGVTINGDLSFPVNFARVVIAGGTTFSTAHLSGLVSEIAFAPAQTLTGTIQFEGAGGNIRYVSMSTPGSLTIGATGVIKTLSGLTGDAVVGVGSNFTAAMALTNNGLISSEISGRTITVNPATSFANGATGTLQATGGGILTIAPSGAWTNAGMINVNAATVNLGGTLNTTGGIGTWSNTGGTVNVTGTISNTASTLTLNNATGSWTLNGGTVSGGTLALTDGKTLLIGANSANTLSGVTINGDLSFPVNFARVVIAGGTTFSTAHLSGLVSEISFAPAQTLSGTIQFEGAGGNIRYVSMSTPGSLTIGATGVIKTLSGLTGDAVVGVGSNFTAAMALTNNGLISSEISGRTITVNPATSFANGATGTLQATGGGILTIAPSGAWTNAGMINVNAATVNLGGTLNTTGGIGTWSNTGGTVNVTGTISNTASTLTLNNATGSWTLNGGTVSGGTLALTDGKTLLIGANSANTLSGVTINGDLSFPVNFARVVIAGGTTFSTAHLSGLVSEISFAPAQTLSGTIQFEGAGGNIRYVSMSTPGSLTIGATGVIKTLSGLTGDAVVGVGSNFTAAMALTNNGLISSEISGRTITVNPATSFANGATGTLQATGGGILTIAPSGAWTNAGMINVNAATVNLGGTLNTTGGIGTWSNTGGTVNVTGTISNTASTLTLNNATGSWTLNGGTVSGGTLALTDGKTLLIGANSANTLSGVTINGDLSFPVNFARVVIAGGTTFSTAHLSGLVSEISFAPAQTLSGTIQFEGAGGNIRYVSMSTPGSLTIGATGVIKTLSGLTGDAVVGVGSNFTAAMALTNNGLISSEISGRTITVNPANGFTNGGTLEAINGGSLAVPLGYTQTAGITRLSGGGTISALTAPTLNTITVAGGRLEANGTITANVANSATIAISPGLSAGTLPITGDLTLTSTSALEIEVGGVNQGANFDFLSEAGSVALNLAGTLNITLLNGYVPAPADTLIIVNSNQPLTGMFSNVVSGHVLATDGFTSLQLAVIGNHVVISGLSGDYNRNGSVDAADYVVWRDTLGQSGTSLVADGNHNNQVDAGDYNVWRANFGQTVGSGTSAGSDATVPEPATLVLLMLAMGGWCLERRIRAEWAWTSADNLL